MCQDNSQTCACTRAQLVILPVLAPVDEPSGSYLLILLGMSDRILVPPIW